MESTGRIDHVNNVVVCENDQEFRYMISWCNENDKGLPFSGDPTFPICIGTGQELAGWTQSMDRALYYMPFLEFIQKVNK